MLNRRRRTSTASLRFGISGTRIRRTLEGRCVKTIVRISPMHDASREARRADIPAKTFAQKKIAPSAAGLTPNRRKNQYAAKLCTTNPPANESRANRLESLSTTCRDRVIPKAFATVVGDAAPSAAVLTSAKEESRA